MGLKVKVYGLDTFEGMPPTDKEVDAHNAGDFAGVDLKELRDFVASAGLSEHLEFVQGIFEVTAPAILAEAPPVLLAHIDCDVYTSVAFAWDVVKPYMASGGYVAFDDAHVSSCLGATEAVEDLAIRRDGLNCEQIWPHFVFRVWQGGDAPEQADESVAGVSHAGPATHVRRAENPDPQTSVTKAALEAASRENSRLQKQYLELAAKLTEAREEIRETDKRLAESRSRLADLIAKFGTLSQQVSMGSKSRWLRLGRLLGIGPEFQIPK